MVCFNLRDRRRRYEKENYKANNYKSKAAVKEETVTTAAKDTTKEAAPVKETVKKATDH